MTGELIGGHYLLKKQLQDNNSCQTHLAEDTHLQGKYYVVKKLQLKDPALSSTHRRLFDREVQTLYRLGEHPQIPELKARFEENEAFYLVQEFIQGEDLRKREIPHKQWTKSQVIDFLVDVLGILLFVHKHKVIHRDIKPSNLIRRESDSKIVLIDFGAVKHIATNINKQNNFTIVGTPGYMPPEQGRGEPAFCSDIYALGMTEIAALTGVEPNHLGRDAQREVVWRDRASVSSGLADILDKMVRDNSVERYQTAQEVLNDLQQSPPPPPPPPPPPWMLYVGVAIGLAAIVAAGLSLIIPHVNRTVKAIALYDEANQLIDRKKYEEAIAAFDAALDIKPDFAEAWADRGYALGQSGKHQEKLLSCDRAILLDPKLPEAWICRGLARHSLQQHEQAINDYEKAININGNLVAAWHNKGETLLQMQEHQAALEAVDKAIEIEPDYLFAWNFKCQVHFELEQYREAEKSCVRALSIDQNYQPAKQRLEWIKKRLGK